MMRLLCQVFPFRGQSLNYYRTSSVLFKIVQFKLSDIGEGIREVTLRDWFVTEGEGVKQFEKVCLVESDKASVTITSRYDGTVKKLYYNLGDVALVGQPLLDIDIEENDSSTEEKVTTETQNTTVSPPPRAQFHQPSEITQTSTKQGNTAPKIIETIRQTLDESIIPMNKSLATPAVRRIAKENNIKLNEVKATGKGGRVMKEDILQHLNNCKTPHINLSNEEQKEPLTSIQKAMFKTMTKSNSIPTFGYCDEIDMTSLINIRNDVKKYADKKGINITYMPFFIKALSKALEEYPELNSTVDESGEFISYKSEHNIGVAIDSGKGLIVPNIKNVQKLSVLEIGKELGRLIELGRKLELGISDITGGTITISNIGIIGGTYLRPLILPPEVCILALGKARLVPVFDENSEITKRHVLQASWAADHRIIDGATIAKFSNTWKEYIEKPNYLLMNL